MCPGQLCQWAVGVESMLDSSHCRHAVAACTARCAVVFVWLWWLYILNVYHRNLCKAHVGHIIAQHMATGSFQPLHMPSTAIEHG